MFKPSSDEHALVEAVFGLVLDRPWNPLEVASIRNAHDQWKKFLPKVNEITTHQIVLGMPNMPGLQFPVNAPATGVVFERVNPDGTLAWRLTVDQNSLLINCLNYSRWQEVWPIVANLLRDVYGACGRTDICATGVLFQTIDAFVWSDHVKDHSIDQLLDLSSDYVTQHIVDKGPFWHLHQGWFSDPCGQLPGRLLNRVHIDSVQTNNIEIKIDTVLQNSFSERVDVSEAFVDGGRIWAEFNALHQKNKDLLRLFLTKSALDAINLV